ncbi:hypothetical protein KIW84_051120 [Lathyrus oleraceus]|uniref:Secreted protein n=1 Tax=Pisum sativum TaxID=3888 RepID=A0A9D4WNQ1_PEA|nr:hypothetical protein KIW84_051120 [Pisum sativum]
MSLLTVFEQGLMVLLELTAIFVEENAMCNDGAKGAVSPTEVCEGLALLELRNRKWHTPKARGLNGGGLDVAAWLVVVAAV